MDFLPAIPSGESIPFNVMKIMEAQFVLRRSHKRLPFGFRAELIAFDVTYEAFVENISENGMNLKIIQITSDHTFDYVSDVLLKLHPEFGKRIHLNGRKKWSSKNTPNSVIESIGIELIDPPPEYRKLYQIISLS